LNNKKNPSDLLYNLRKRNWKMRPPSFFELAGRKRELEEEKSNIIEMEAKQPIFFNVETQFQILSAYINLTTIEKSRDLMEKLAKVF
jgi:hypothetical protein